MIMPISPQWNLSNKNRYKFLVVKTHNIGNIINITPFLLALKKEYLASDIDFLCESNFKDVLKDLRCINKIYTFDNLPTVDYDVVFEGAPHRNILIGTKDYKEIISFQNVIKADPNEMKYITEVETNFRMLLNITNNQIPIPNTFITPREDDTLCKKYFCISAGYGPDHWAFKNWGYENFARLSEKLVEEYDLDCYVMGKGRDADVLKYTTNKRIINKTNTPSVVDASMILRNAEFLVSNDTGLAHVAAAVGTTVYQIFGPTSIVKNLAWRFGYPIRKCSHEPCQNRDMMKFWQCSSRQCLKELSPDYVFNEIKSQRRDLLFNIILCNTEL